jgi:acetyl esterase/lipase
MKRHIDLVYATVGDRALHLDLYLPEEAERPLPVVVWVHGGAWRQGTKDHPPALRLVSQGYAAASVEYRLSQEAIFPAQIHDCKAAVRWLRAHAGDYGLDPDRFGAWGGSAGGHLVALLGTSAGVTALEGDLGNADRSSAVQAVCDWYGPSNFLHMNDEPGVMDHDAPDSPESQLIGAPIQEDPDLVAKANPITYITGDEPPFLLMHGTADRVVLPNQSRLLHAALVEAEVSSTLMMLGGLGHGFGNQPGRLGEIYGYVRSFFDAYL